jgi:hypothetical protein
MFSQGLLSILEFEEGAYSSCGLMDRVDDFLLLDSFIHVKVNSNSAI